MDKNKKGFSLVELLAVIVILGLLMTFAISSASRLIIKSKYENIDSHKKTLIMAAESYLQDNKDELPKSTAMHKNCCPAGYTQDGGTVNRKTQKIDYECTKTTYETTTRKYRCTSSQYCGWISCWHY